MADTPPDPWSLPDPGVPGSAGNPSPAGWGAPVPPAGWVPPPPPAGSGPQPPPGQQWPQGQQQWGDFTPPPGWRPPPTRSVKTRGVVAGLGAWLAVNALLLSIGEPMLILLANVAVVIIAAAKGYKSFAIGFALGYVVAFVLFLGACFVFLAVGSSGGGLFG